MATVRFEDWDRHQPLTKEEVRDLVDLLFRFEGNITVYGKMRAGEKNTLLGLHCYNSFFGQHEIWLAPDRIAGCVRDGRRAGGNRPVTDPRLAVGMVLAHELQHGNQHHVHESTHNSFFGKRRSRYRTRPSEREARQFADDSIPQIAAVLGIHLAREGTVQVPQDELGEVVELLAEGDQVSGSDITEELRLSGLNNAVNFRKVRELLADRGVLLDVEVVD